MMLNLTNDLLNGSRSSMENSHEISKVFMYNRNNSKSNVSRGNKLIPQQQQQQLGANQVLIIHQNNSLSNNHDELNMVTSEEDVKYMKGYVNVIKERFARRSLGSGIVQPDLVDSVNQSQRLSIGEYQRRKTSQKSVLAEAYRRRSASPFIPTNLDNNNANKTLSTNQNQAKQAPIYGKNQHRKLFASSDDLRPVMSGSASSTSSPPLSSTSSPSSSTSSSDNLFHHNKKFPTTTNIPTNTLSMDARNSSQSVDHLLTNEVVKCTYFNEINKDELPKPNFVSSVKNLFERQINNGIVNSGNLMNYERAATNNIASIKANSVKSLTNNNHYQQQVLLNNNNNNNNSLAAPVHNTLLIQASQKNISVENLVDKLKQNGTIVYEHNSVVLSPQPINPTRVVSEQAFTPQTHTKINNVSTSSLNQATAILTQQQQQQQKTPKLQDLKANDQTKQIDFKPNVVQLAQNSVESKENANESINRVLSFQERKEMFNKASPTKSRHSSSALTNASNNIESNKASKDDASSLSKRQKIEKDTPALNKERSIELNEDNVELNNLEEESLLDDDVASMSANEVLNSAQQQNKQKSKLKSKSIVKTKTFYGGEEVKDVSRLNLATPIPNMPMRIVNGTDLIESVQATVTTSVESFHYEFVGAGVKLEKSILCVRGVAGKSRKRINFTDAPQTYEYPSYEFVLREMGFDPDNDPDYQIVPADDASNYFSLNDDGYANFLPARKSASDFDEEEDEDDEDDEDDDHVEDYVANNEKKNEEKENYEENENSLKISSKGSFTNFKPSWQTINYELGSIDKFENRFNEQSQSQKANLSKKSSNGVLVESFKSFLMPSKDDEVKQWSSEMDSNILF